MAIPLAPVALLCALLAAAPASAVETERVTDSPADVRGYWTAARMRAAEPLESPPAADAPTRRGLGCLLDPCAVAVSDPGSPEFSPHGKVYFTVPSGTYAGDYVCSGTVVNSRSRSVVWTAGHCVFSPDGEGDGDVPGFVSNWVFVPAYQEGLQPFGQWTAKRLATTGPWQGTGNIKYDLGAAVVRKDADGRRLQALVGGRGIAFDRPRGQRYRAIGYPAEPIPNVRFTGEQQYFCDSAPIASDDPGTAGPATIAIRCDMTGGSSGGGWIVKGKLRSVTSYGYSQELDRLFGPYMSSSAKALYRSVRGKPKGKAGGKKGGKGGKR